MGSYQLGMGLQGFVQGATDFAKIFMGLLQLQQEQEYKDKLIGIQQQNVDLDVQKLNMLKQDAEKKDAARKAAAEILRLSQESQNYTPLVQNTTQPQQQGLFQNPQTTQNYIPAFRKLEAEYNKLYNTEVPQFIIGRSNNSVDNFITDRSNQIYEEFPSFFATTQDPSTETTPITNNANTSTITKTDLEKQKQELIAKIIEANPETISEVANAIAILNPRDELAEKFKYDVAKMKLEYLLKDDNKFEQIITDADGKVYGITHNTKTNEINVVPLQIKDGKYMLDLKQVNKKSYGDVINNLNKVSEALSRSISTSANTLSTLFNNKMSDNMFTIITKMQNDPNSLTGDDVKSLYNQISKLPDTDPNKPKAIALVKSIFSNFNSLSQVNKQLLKNVGIKPDNYFDFIKDANPTNNLTNFYNNLLKQQQQNPKKR